MPKPFDRNKLSERENTILDLAIEGLTDFQIALKLGIRPSTVNSYWVRIRTKLGSLSRTELVALALKEEASARLQADQQTIQALRASLNDARKTDYEIANTALDYAPEAIVVMDRHQKVLLANHKAEILFGYDRKAMIGMPASKLLAEPGMSESTFELADFHNDPVSGLAVGTNEPVIARRKDGREFRAVVLLSKAKVDSGWMLVCQWRPYLEEMYLRSHRAWPAFDLI